MDNKFYVPQETAEKLKEAGYPVEQIAHSLLEPWQDAPITYHEAVDWLESKGLYIDYGTYSCYNNVTKEHKMTYIAHVSIYVPHLHGSKDWYQTKTYDSREEALDEAILAAIDILKQKQ